MRIDRAFPEATAAHEGVLTLRRAAAAFVATVTPLLPSGRHEDFLADVGSLSATWETLVAPPLPLETRQEVPDAPAGPPPTPEPPTPAKRSSARRTRKK